jgi:DNA-binding CsgD family transcriptional regulator
MSEVPAEREFTENVRRAVEQMRAMQEGVRQFEEISHEHPTLAAGLALRFAAEEGKRKQRMLKEHFGLVVRWEGREIRCSLVVPERAPRTSEQAKYSVDVLVSLISWQLALRAMRHARAYFTELDRDRKICHALVDVMEQAPAAYSFFTQEGFDPSVREYATAVATAWTRSKLRFHGGIRATLQDENWVYPLASATIRGWEELKPSSPMTRSTRFRDTLPKTVDGRRQRATGPKSYINVVDTILTDRGNPSANSPERELARFANREELLKRARDAGLTPREMELFEFFIKNPGAKYREAADKLGMSVQQVGVLKHRIKETLNAS